LSIGLGVFLAMPLSCRELPCGAQPHARVARKQSRIKISHAASKGLPTGYYHCREYDGNIAPIRQPRTCLTAGWLRMRAGDATAPARGQPTSRAPSARHESAHTESAQA